MSLKHTFVSTKPQSHDTTKVRKNAWNEDHVFDFNGLVKSVSNSATLAVAGTDYLVPNSDVTLTSLTLTVATGTAPLSVTSTTLVTNLNTDLLDGVHASSFVNAVSDTASIDLTLAGQSISGAVLPAGVDHNSLANLTVGDVHTQYLLESGSIASITTRDHDLLNGLTDDDHTQYTLLAGRAGGQTLIGGINASNNLTLQSTSNATKGSILFGTSAYDEVNNRLGIGTASPSVTLQVEGNQIIDNTSTEAFLVRKNLDAADVFNVDTTNKRIYMYGGGGANLPTFDYWAGWMKVGAEHNLPTRTNDIYKLFNMRMAGINSTTQPEWNVLTIQSNPTVGKNTLDIGGGGKGATEINFFTSSGPTVNTTKVAKIEYTGTFMFGAVGRYIGSGSFAAIDGAGVYIFDDATLGAEMITNAADRTLDAGYTWTFTGLWSRVASGGNPDAAIYHSSTSNSTGVATLAAANLTGQLKANRWYKLQVDVKVPDWNAAGFYITNATSAEWTQMAGDNPNWVTNYRYFRPTADGVDLVLGWYVSGKSDQVYIDNISLKELQAGDLDMGGAFHGRGSIIRGTAGYDVDPESDIDTDILTLNVTGTPKLFWDESEDAFSQNKGQRLTDGAISVAVETIATLGVGATSFAVDSNVCVITGDAGGNTIATITGGKTGQTVILLFTDALVTITDDNTHAANSVDLSAAFTSADDTILQLMFNGTSWYEVSRSVN